MTYTLGKLCNKIPVKILHRNHTWWCIFLDPQCRCRLCL